MSSKWELYQCATASVGIVVSLYALSIEKAVHGGAPIGEAMCDISPSMSCSKVLGSDYSIGFGMNLEDLPSIPELR
jgi:uncharacterized membrane protein